MISTGLFERSCGGESRIYKNNNKANGESSHKCKCGAPSKFQTDVVEPNGKAQGCGAASNPEASKHARTPNPGSAEKGLRGTI
ncbi:hypothetical protein BH24GEM2_BH24GEM2_03860 [soil metagenome]